MVGSLSSTNKRCRQVSTLFTLILRVLGANAREQSCCSYDRVLLERQVSNEHRRSKRAFWRLRTLVSEICPGLRGFVCLFVVVVVFKCTNTVIR